MRIPDLRRLIRADRGTTLVAVLALVPVVAAATRALVSARVLLGDNAMIATRAHDVLTRHHPLLGTWSSASVETGVQVNHPGPLLFDLLAPFVRVLGMHDGTVVGVALLNATSIVVAAVLAHRVGGRVAARTVLLAALVLEYTVGTALLVDPWNPHAIVFPFFAFVVSTWGVATGDRRSIAWFVVLGSLCMQVHLGAVVVVPSLGLAAVWFGWWSNRASAPHPLRPDRGWTARMAAIIAVSWCQPVAEVVLHGGDSNIARLAASGGGGSARIGAVDALRFLSAVVLQTPWTTRATFMSAIPPTGWSADGQLLPVVTRSAVVAGLSMVVVGAVLLASWRLAGRGGRSRNRAVIQMCGVSMVVGWLSMAVMPLGPFGLTAHQMRWMWPLAASVWCGVALVVVDHLSARVPTTGRVPAAAAAAVGVAAAALAGAAVPGFVQPAGPATQASLEPVVADLVGQLGDADLRGEVLVDHAGTPLFDGTWDAVVAALVEDGVDVRVDGEALSRHYGAGRRADGDEPTVIAVRWGADAVAVPADSTRLAFVDPDPSDPTRALAVVVVER